MLLMRSLVLGVLVLVSGCAGRGGGAAPIPAAHDAAFENDFTGFIDRLRDSDPLAPPGFAVVVVHGEDTVFERTYGVRDLRTGAPMTLDTPIYNASVTKAYTGLLASVLDAEGVLRFDETLTDVWPSLALPPPIDASQITVRRLLSHTSGFDDTGLQYRSFFSGDAAAAMVPGHLAHYARPLPNADFRYSNLGPFVYSAMVEARTGEPWADALRRRVLDPMGLTRTIARLEDLPEMDVGHCNTLGADGAWRALPHKPTATMNAAGGLYASGRDTGRFLQAFLTDGASAGGAISPDVLGRTWARAADRSQDIFGMHRDGYGLGWDLGEMGGQRFVSRSGGYSGCRSFIMMFPDLSLGVAVLSASDAAGNTFNAAILHQALEYWTDAQDAGARADASVEGFVQAARSEAARYAQEWATVANLGPVDAATRRAASGRYVNARLGQAEISDEDGDMIVQLGVARSEVRRAPDGHLFITTSDEAGALAFSVVRDARGLVTAIQWDDDTFERSR